MWVTHYDWLCLGHCASASRNKVAVVKDNAQPRGQAGAQLPSRYCELIAMYVAMEHENASDTDSPFNAVFDCTTHCVSAAQWVCDILCYPLCTFKEFATMYFM